MVKEKEFVLSVDDVSMYVVFCFEKEREGSQEQKEERMKKSKLEMMYRT